MIIGEDVEKSEALYITGKNVQWYSQFEKQSDNSSKN